MPFPFSRRSKTEYAAVEANDYDGLEADGVDVLAASPKQSPQASRTARVSSRQSQLSGSWTEIGLPKSSPPLPNIEGSEHAETLTLHTSRDDAPMSHPAPGLETAKGAYLDNIMRLEDSAAKMSIGMDIDNELKKLREEQKLSESRRSSIQASRPQSLRNSVNLNLGEFASPSTYLFGSGNQLQGPSSTGRSSTPTKPIVTAYRQSVQPIQSTVISPAPDVNGILENEAEKGKAKEVASPKRRSKVIQKPVEPRKIYLPPLEPTYDDDGEPVYTPYVEPPHQVDLVARQELEAHPENDLQEHDEMKRFSKRRESVGSMDTFQQANVLFRDFDGAHIDLHNNEEDEASSLMDDPEVRASRRASRASRTSKRASRRHSDMTITQKILEVEDSAEKTEQTGEGEDAEARRQSMLSLNTPDVKRKSTMTMGPVRPITPPDGHLYYPAPIPAILHLPPKLSQGRNHAELQRKKGEIIMAANLRKSRLQPGMYDASSMRGDPNVELDPHLKASLYFDHKLVKHVLRPIEGSATRTLDHILNVSAGAPLGAFTDHPYAGKLGPEVYGPEMTEKERKDQALAAAAKRRRSKMPLETAYRGRSGDAEILSPEEGGEKPFQEEDYDRFENGPPPEEANNFQNGVPEYIPIDSAKPTTLLAELQLRKQEQKQRNRTAATAFPNGMHSTLLQLDAVAQHQAKTRRGRHIHLAWEDPEALLHDEDDEVPLGMLMPGAKRPEGTLLPPVPQPREMTPSPTHDGFYEQEYGEEDEEDSDEPEETMAERKARLAREAEEKKRYTLSIDGFAEKEMTSNRADSDDDDVPLAVRKARLHRRNSSAFTSEIMSQFDTLEDEEKNSEAQSSPARKKKIPARHRASRSMLSTQLSSNGGEKIPEAEETLGQRRRRLQAEQAIRDDAKRLQKEVRRRQSSVDLLASVDGRNVDEDAEQADQNNPWLSQRGGLPGMSGINPLGSTATLVMGPNGVLQYTTDRTSTQQQWQQAEAQPQPQYQYQVPSQHPPQTYVHPAYAASTGLAQLQLQHQHQHQQQQVATMLGRPGHLSAYQQQQMMSGMGAMSNRMSQLSPSINPGRRDMVDRWRQGVPG